ncbi:hypothetical protein ONZ51_g8139 [Trametes cubensis]|uniref:Uncharacterized protein n=1 Tax=Trametes cubensis TaxID=1111947 RepID=A0AAD7TNT6_9APHY|nr:hypothetical protein ONZ51_g8139 [Trametes cubensis]
MQILPKTHLSRVQRLLKRQSRTYDIQGRPGSRSVIEHNYDRDTELWVYCAYEGGIVELSLKTSSTSSRTPPSRERRSTRKYNGRCELEPDVALGGETGDEAYAESVNMEGDVVDASAGSSYRAEDSDKARANHAERDAGTARVEWL